MSGGRTHSLKEEVGRAEWGHPRVEGEGEMVQGWPKQREGF